MSVNYLPSNKNERVQLAVTPETAGWKYLSFSVCDHSDGAIFELSLIHI